MKATFTLALFMFIGMFAFGQTDTVYYTSGCDRSFYNEVYNFHLGNNTFLQKEEPMRTVVVKTILYILLPKT